MANEGLPAFFVTSVSLKIATLGTPFRL